MALSAVSNMSQTLS